MRWLGVALAVVLAVTGCGVRRATTGPQPGPVTVRETEPPPCILKFRDKKAERAARARLERDLRRYLARQPGRIAFSAHDLATGIRLGHREHQRDMITASGSKVDILAALLQRRHRLSPAERDLAARMIRESDNGAADALWWRVGGGGAMARFYRLVGMRETVPGPSRFWGGTTTSPADRIRLLKLLVKGGRGLTERDRSLVLSLMGRVMRDQAWGVSAAARPGEKVALKNGWTPRPFRGNTWAVTSYGRISGPGRDLLLAVQTDMQPGEGSGIRAIEGLARMIGRRLGDLRQERTVRCPASL